ncbi:MAG: hypothetical protein JWQ71_3057 [Pedosphaera sp.]|nr:hypothetical protein [Pedosphaera sp.]
MLTPLEKAVLAKMLDKPGELFAIARQQLAQTTVAKREFSGVGFFTEFVIPADAQVRRNLPKTRIGAVGAEFSGLQHGAGFVLFIENGVISMLEGYTYDEPWPENTDVFRLITLHDLTIRRNRHE